MPTQCAGCRDGAAFERRFSMAFQPIVDIGTGAVFAHEALVRGINGEGAGTVLSAVTDENRYAFDQQCRVTAIELAAKLGLNDSPSRLSINFLPNAVYEPRACIRLTLGAATRTGLSPDKLIFEFTENEEIDTNHLLGILRTYRSLGFLTAIDDFGAGSAGLGLLAHFQPDIVKLDMALIRGVDTDRVRQRIVGHMVQLLDELSIETVCEGIETEGEYQALRDLGVTLMQGYFFAKPAFEALVEPTLPSGWRVAASA